MSSAELRPEPDHKIQLSHAAGVVPPAGSESKEGLNTTTASQAESLLGMEKLAYILAADIDDRKSAAGELERAFEKIRKSEAELRTIIDAINSDSSKSVCASFLSPCVPR